uniref:Uncharacterized protein n=1 Tax=Candidatus Kentrum sp. TUN TaxID=2126343 RepID=A0A450ZPL3_9GAMM|nr:MAG: hypothetical protein BECKTUN1418F_GA0071002_10235 [Candidatus Kentron sp. TUN]VFK55648.1 MAG: hypothetical protein BECKTUN1418E_GA0071001_103117 [Candidatus Kentron sp. TUN]
MTAKQIIRTILHRFWLWPLIFYLRPLEVFQKFRDAKPTEVYIELIAAVLGGALWGVLFGGIVWAVNDDIHAIWILALAFAIAFALAVDGVGADTGVGGVAGAVAGATTATGVGIAAFVAAAAGLGVFAFSGTGVVFGTILVAVVVAIAGIAVNSWLPAIGENSIVLILSIAFSLFSLWVILARLRSRLHIPDWVKITWIFLWLLGIPLAAFILFPRISNQDALSWGISLIFAIGIGSVAGFYEKIYLRIGKNTLHELENKQYQYPFYLWILSLTLAAIAWFPDPPIEELSRKLEILALFLALIPVLFTGLLLYPLVALTALWQCRASRARADTQEQRKKLLPLRWQTFAYPLPGIRPYLVKLARHQGVETGLWTLQHLQFHSLQISATRLAAREIATRPDTALLFCATLLLKTNFRTLLPFAQTGPAAFALAALTRRREKEEEEPLQLYFRRYPPKASHFSGFPGLGRAQDQKLPGWFTELQEIRQKELPERLPYSLAALEKCSGFDLATETLQLILALQRFAIIGNAGELMALSSAFQLPQTFDPESGGGKKRRATYKATSLGIGLASHRLEPA